MRTPTAGTDDDGSPVEGRSPLGGLPDKHARTAHGYGAYESDGTRLPQRQVLPKRVGEQERQGDARDGAGERGKHAEGRGRNDDCGQGHGDRPASEHDGGTCLRRRRGGALPAGSGLRVVFPLLAHGDNGIMAASGKEPHRRSGIHSLPWRQAPAGTVPARTKASTFLASTAAARPVFGYHTYGRKSWLEEAAR